MGKFPPSLPIASPASLIKELWTFPDFCKALSKCVVLLFRSDLCHSSGAYHLTRSYLQSWCHWYAQAFGTATALSDVSIALVVLARAVLTRDVLRTGKSLRSWTIAFLGPTSIARVEEIRYRTSKLRFYIPYQTVSFYSSYYRLV